MSKILVTGGTGFVGRSVIHSLISAGHEVRCAVREKDSSLPVKDQVKINPIELQTDWSHALNDIDIVIHLAAKVHVMKKGTVQAENEYYAINSLASQNLAVQAVNSGVKRFVFLSTIKVNGEDSLENKPFTETSEIQTEGAYAKSKWMAEQYLRSVCENTAMDLVILRPALVYGPSVKANFLNMLRFVRKGWPLPFASVHNRRSLVYIDNLVSAIILVMEHPKAANELYLVADNDSFSLAELLSILAQYMSIKLNLFKVPPAMLKIMFRVAGKHSLGSRLFNSLEISSNKLQEDLGWTPPVSSHEGLSQTARWYNYEYHS